MSDLPLTQKVAVVVREGGSGEPFRFEVRSVPVPEIKAWEVLVRLSVSGVCGTDLGLASGHLGPACDIVGHEGVGRVVRLGSGVDPAIIHVGERVGVAWVRDACGKCQPCCELGGETRCTEQLNSGRKIDGTFAQYCVVPARYVLRLPDELDLGDELIAPILCGGVTAYKAIKSCRAVPGDWIVVLGAAGGVGALAVQYGKAMGYRVIAIDLGDERRESCIRQGAEAYLDALSEATPSAVTQVTRGAKAKAVIVTAGSGKAYQSAMEYVAPFGSIVCVGIPPPSQTMNIHPIQLIDSGVSLFGILVGTRTDTREALEFVRRGNVVPAIIPIQLEELEANYKNVATATGKYIITL
ncbi:alcohol dehydrogenase [Truncatella angustata]|uniref:alcohol dehydrogenase n=1 Tax=Truncatella angustata TaxID=152316 RepID=A0A9P8RG84_9PEZI|nr:alcohol dehydrogenase [Truncatella angustata]KAH6645282.1 alcohol dehydrogenase [Truncatella angustata]KAH8203337.1 hypothetical protein TruAng_002533 [Truncatella angustata]